MKLQDQTIKINNRSVSYVEGGGGPSLVYIHGWPLTSRSTDPMLQALAEDFHLYAPKLPGFGDSEPLDSEHTVENFANFLEDFIAALDLGKVVLMGCSLGGAIGLSFTLRNQERVGALVLVGAPASFRHLANRKIRAICTVLSSLLEKFKPTESFLDTIIHNDRLLGLAWSLITPRDPDYPRLKDDPTTIDLRKIPLPISKEVLEDILHFDLISLCGRLKDLPVLLLAGQNDVLVPVAAVKEIDQAIGTSIFMVVPYAEHWNTLTDDSLRLIKNFLLTHSPTVGGK